MNLLSNNAQKYAFPSLNTPESEKKEEYHKQYTQAIINRSINEGYSSRVAIANECVNFYLGLQSNEAFSFLQRAEDGDTLPAQFMNYNRINNKINIMVGELVEKKYDINVFGLNKDLVSRKLQSKQKALIDFRFQADANDLAQVSGLPPQAPTFQGAFQPESEQDIDDYYEKDYKDIAEIVIKAILKALIPINKWDYQRVAMFRDLLIQGMAFCRIDDIDGIPVAKRVDPRNMVFDANSTDDFLSDSTYFGEIDYMNFGDVIDQYGLTKKELDEAYQQSGQMNFNAGPQFMSVSNDFNVIGNNTNLRFFKNEGGELRILVWKAVWVDYKPYSNKISTDKFGQEHIKRVDADSKEKDVKKTLIKTWRKATLIGGRFVKDWGEIKNQARDWSNLSNAHAPYKALIPNFFNGAVVSKVSLLKSLQNLKDIALYRLQLDMARSGPKAFFYDMNQIPPGMTFPQVMKYLKTTGIIPIDSNASGNPTGFNQFKDIDMSMTANITAYLEISAMLDREMDAVSGINEARQGMVKNASQAVGVTQSSLFQSTLSTAVYYSLFRQLCSDVLNHQAKLAKLAWAGNQRFSPLIGDLGIEFLANDVDLDLHDYGVIIEEVPELIQDKQSFQQIVLAALQSGQLTFPQAMNLMLEKDLQLGVRRLEREHKKFMEEQAKQQEAMMQQQQQELAAQQQQAEGEKRAEQMNSELDRQASMKELLAKGRLDMKGQLIDFKKDVTLAKMQKDLEKQKAASKPKG